MNSAADLVIGNFELSRFINVSLTQATRLKMKRLLRFVFGLEPLARLPFFFSLPMGMCGAQRAGLWLTKVTG